MTDRKIPAAFFAVLVHLAFLAVLIFGFRWQESEPVVLQAQIWQDLPPIEAHELQPLPPPVPKPEPRPVPKPVPEPRPAVDPEIALKKAREKRIEQEKIEKQKELEKRQKELQKQKELEKQKEEKLRQEKLKAQKLKLEKQKALQAQQERVDALNRMMQAKAAAARQGLVDQYKARIRSKIKRYVVVPPGMQGNPEAEFEVVLLPDGEVLRATLLRSSGYPAYDAAVERAILRASPLPLPPDASLFEQFRTLDLHFSPNE